MPAIRQEPPMIPKCRDMTELATDYAEGALSWRQWLGVRWHLPRLLRSA
jgi:hypothetical protein